MGLLKELTKEQQTNILAQYLPDDRLHCAKNVPDSNLRKLLEGLACAWLDERNIINRLFDQYNPEFTTDFITEWEGFVGIPDECFGNTGTIEERRQNILLKLAGVNVTTAKQFEEIAAILGFTVIVKSGVDESTLPQTLPFLLISGDEAPYTIVVDTIDQLPPAVLPQTLPFILGAGPLDILRCLFEKLKPANTQVIFKYYT